MIDAVYSITCIKHAQTLSKCLGGVPFTIGGNTLHIGAFAPDLLFCKENNINNILWVGSDVLDFKNNTNYLNFISSINNYCVWNQLQKELKEFEIEAEVIPLLPIEEPIIKRKPENIIYMYLPVELPFKYSLFQVDGLIKIAKALPGFKFIGVGCPINPHLNNWIDAGYLTDEQLRNIWKKTLLNIRFTLHDGCPNDIVRCGQHGILSIVDYLDMPFTKRFHLKNIQHVINFIKKYKEKETKNRINYFRKEIYKEGNKWKLI